MQTIIWGGCVVGINGLLTANASQFVEFEADGFFIIAREFTLKKYVESTSKDGLCIEIKLDASKISVHGINLQDMFLEVIVFYESKKFFSGRRFTADQCTVLQDFNLSLPHGKPFYLGLRTSSIPLSGEVNITFSEFHVAVIKSAEQLIADYAGFLENNWWPERFNLKLHQVGAIISQGVLRKGGNALDLGANRGQQLQGIIEAMNGKSGKVVAVEANPAVFPILVEKFNSLNQKIHFENLVIMPKVIKSMEQGIEFYMSEKYTEIGSANRNYVKEYFPHIKENEFYAVSVPAITLDDLLRKHDLLSLDYIKVDIEGLDMDVLLNSELVWQSGAVMYFEYNYYVARPHEFHFFQKAMRFSYRLYDCFLNELDDWTWRFPTICPLDRVAIPASFDPAIIDDMRKKIAAVFP